MKDDRWSEDEMCRIVNFIRADVCISDVRREISEAEAKFKTVRRIEMTHNTLAEFNACRKELGEDDGGPFLFDGIELEVNNFMDVGDIICVYEDDSLMGLA